MEITKLNKVNYVDEVSRQMYEMIVSGTWHEGQKLPSETQLAREFAVSRIVIREALQRLRADKRIVTYQGRGSFCANPNNFEKTLCPAETDVTEDLFRQFVDFRSCVELEAFFLAAQNRTDGDLLAIRAAFEKMSSQDSKSAKYSEWDFKFHYLLVSASHNQFLISAMESNRDVYIRCLRKPNVLKESQKFSLDFHERLIDHLEMRTAKEAVHEMRLHDTYNLARLFQDT